jgi:PKD repeat protein
MGRAFLVRLIAVAALAVSACTVHDTETPGLTGPSEFATSIEVTATPDHVRQDGESQSTIAVRARDANGQAKAGLALRLGMSVNGTVQDFGTLSARNVVTGSDGRATVVYTAPSAPPAGAGGSGTTIDIVATSLGTNAQNSQTQTASIALVPPGVILPPGGNPVASFVVSPVPVSAGVSTRFDATASLPGLNSTRLISYAWSFGDGSSANTSVANHTFTAAGAYSVTLTVTNDRGLSASTTQAVSVVTTALPTANFAFSPSAPLPGALVQFNGGLSAAAPGRTIVQYLWNWGDGDNDPPPSGVTQEHDYQIAGTYTVVLTVIDDLGQRGTKATPVVVGSSGGPNLKR